MKAHIIIGFLLVMASLGYAASCNDIDVVLRDVSIAENSTEYFIFDLENDSDEEFDVFELVAGDSSSRFNVSVSDYDDPIEEYDEGTLEIKIRSFAVSNDYEDEAFVKLRGEFDGGRYCSFGAIGTEYFDVTVEDGSGSESCSDIEVVASNVTMDESDIVIETVRVENNAEERFYVDDVELSESSSYISVDVDDYDDYINDGDNGEIDIEIESMSVGSDKTASVKVEVRGHFSNGRTCSFSQTEDDTFTVRIENEGSGNFVGGTKCDDLRLDVSNLSVEKGETVEEEFVLENRANERFYVDFVDVYDRSGDIKTESNGYDKRIYADGIGLVGVKVRAYNDAEIGEETAYIAVRGHFQGGSTCRLQDNEESFDVDIVENVEVPYVPPQLPVYSNYCDGFVLSAPSTKTLNQAGTIALIIENNTPHRATVRFYGNGLDVEPSLLSVPAGFKSSGYVISVFATKASSMLNYDVETFNCLMSKQTKVLSTAAEPEDAEEEEEQVAATDLSGIAGTAFAVLGGEAVTAGVLILVLLVMLYLIVVVGRK